MQAYCWHLAIIQALLLIKLGAYDRTFKTLDLKISHPHYSIMCDHTCQQLKDTSHRQELEIKIATISDQW